MENTLKNPLTVIEAIADYNDWDYTQLSNTEVAVLISEVSPSHEIHFIWQQEISYLHLICLSDLEVPKNMSHDFLHLLMLVNQKIWVGSFSVLENNIVAYRHLLHLKGLAYNDFESLLNEVISIALDESESFFPGFEKVLQNGSLSFEDLNLLSVGVEGSA